MKAKSKKFYCQRSRNQHKKLQAYKIKANSYKISPQALSKPNEKSVIPHASTKDAYRISSQKMGHWKAKTLRLSHSTASLFSRKQSSKLELAEIQSSTIQLLSTRKGRKGYLRGHRLEGKLIFNEGLYCIFNL